MQETTISIADLLAVLIRKGKRIILAGVVVAVLLGAFKGFSTWRNLNNEESFDLQQFEYEKELQKLEHIIETATENADKTQEYIDNSLWMQVNPYNKHEAKIYVKISGLDESALNITFGVTETPIDYMMETVTTQYRILWSAADLPSKLEVPVYEGVMDKYVRELISVGTLDTGVLVITAIGNSEAEAKELADAAYRLLLNMQETVVKNSYNHSIEYFEYTVKNQIDEDMARAQSAKYDQIAGYNDTIIEAENEIRGLSAPDSIFAAVIKTMIIGGIVGAILACVWYCCEVLLRGKLQSSAHGERTLNIPFIGSIAPHKGLLCRISSILSGERVWNDESQALAYIAETVKIRLSNKQILLVSSLRMEKYAEAAQKLQATLTADGTQVLCAGDFSHNPDAVAMMGKCDAVMLMEVVDKTKLDEASNILQFAKECEKPVIGFVTL